MNNPMKIIQAGPGAGKTRRLVSLINDLIANGVNPYDIIPMTFSREGTTEITKRLNGDVVAKTNHSNCLNIIKLARKMRGDQPPRIAGEEEVKKMMQRAIVETDKENVVGVSDAIKAYNNVAENDNSVDSIMPELKVVLTRYGQVMESEGLLDFPGILKQASLELEDPEIQSFYAGRYIFLDEAQDISPKGEWPVIEKLLDIAADAWAFTSPSQTIYGFRGSNWNELVTLLPPHQYEYMLENHRSTPEIIQASSVLAGDDAKGMIPVKPSIGYPVRWVDAVNDEYEFDYIAKQIGSWEGLKIGNDNPIQLEDIAILVRLHDQTGPIERTLRSRGVPISYVGGGRSIYETDVAKAVEGYIKLALDGMNDDVLETIIDYPPVGIGSRRKHEIRGGDEFLTWENFALAIKNNQDHPEYVYDRAQELINVREGLRRIMTSNSYPSTSDKLQAVIKCSGIYDYLLAEGDRSGTDALANFVDEANSYKSLHGYAEYLAQEINRPRVSKGVQISTLHASKGREWKAVIMPGMQQGILPHEKGTLTEERNLAFVGMTRAKDHLVLTSSRTAQMSPFLEGTSQEKIVWPR